LVDGFEGAADGDVVFELDGHGLLGQGFEEAVRGRRVSAFPWESSTGKGTTYLKKSMLGESVGEVGEVDEVLITAAVVADLTCWFRLGDLLSATVCLAHRTWSTQYYELIRGFRPHCGARNSCQDNVGKVRLGGFDLQN
jgi:hypothetical protein